jgi:hypothetical protein
MVKVDALARDNRSTAATDSLQLAPVEFLAMALADRDGNSDHLSILCRDVISLGSARRPFSSAVNGRYQHE